MISYHVWFAGPLRSFRQRYGIGSGGKAALILIPKIDLCVFA